MNTWMDEWINSWITEGDLKKLRTESPEQPGLRSPSGETKLELTPWSTTKLTLRFRGTKSDCSLPELMGSYKAVGSEEKRQQKTPRVLTWMSFSLFLWGKKKINTSVLHWVLKKKRVAVVWSRRKRSSWPSTSLISEADSRRRRPHWSHTWMPDSQSRGGHRGCQDQPRHTHTRAFTAPPARPVCPQQQTELSVSVPESSLHRINCNNWQVGHWLLGFNSAGAHGKKKKNWMFCRSQYLAWALRSFSFPWQETNCVTAAALGKQEIQNSLGERGPCWQPSVHSSGERGGNGPWPAALLRSSDNGEERHLSGSFFSSNGRERSSPPKIFPQHECPVCVCCVLSRVRLFVTPGTIAHQAPQPMGFPRQEYWSGCPGHSL